MGQGQWAELRLVSRRLRSGHVVVTLIYRTVDGARVWDRRLGTGSWELHPDEAAAGDAYLAAERSARALLDGRG